MGSRRASSPTPPMSTSSSTSIPSTPGRRRRACTATATSSQRRGRDPGRPGHRRPDRATTSASSGWRASTKRPSARVSRATCEPSRLRGSRGRRPPYVGRSISPVDNHRAPMPGCQRGGSLGPGSDRTTPLDNGLRIILSRDPRAAAGGRQPLVRRRQQAREARQDRVRPPLRAHDVPGLGERGQGRALQPGAGGRRHAQRLDLARPHELLRDAARPRAGAGAVAGGRPDGARCCRR